MTLQSIPVLPMPLIRAAEHGRLVIFVGSGVSKIYDNRYPTWKEFANKVIDNLHPDITQEECKQLKMISDNKTKLSIAESIMETKNIERNCKKHFLLNKNGSPNAEDDPKPDSQIYDILNSFKCAFVTTNYDKLLKPQNNTIKPECEWRIYSPGDFLRSDLENYCVVHLHGCTDDENSMIVSNNNYAEHYTKKSVQNFLTHLFEKKEVLFIGYGMGDQEILEQIFEHRHKREGLKNKVYLLQNFTSDNKNLHEILSSYYDQAYGVELIGYMLPYKETVQKQIFRVESSGYILSYKKVIKESSPDYTHLEVVLKDWADQLKFGNVNLAYEIDLLRREMQAQASSSTQDIIARISKKPDLAKFFFMDADSLSYFDPLEANGHFSLKNYSDNVKDPDFYWYPLWYLKNCIPMLNKPENLPYAKSFLKLIRSLMRDLQQNHKVFCDLISVLVNIPVKLIEKQDLEMATDKLTELPFKYSPTNMIGKWFVKIANTHKDLHETICDSLETILFIKKEYNTIAFKYTIGFVADKLALDTFTSLTISIGKPFAGMLKCLLYKAYRLLDKNLDLFKLTTPHRQQASRGNREICALGILCNAYSQTLDILNSQDLHHNTQAHIAIKQCPHPDQAFESFIRGYKPSQRATLQVSNLENPQELLAELQRKTQSSIRYEEANSISTYIAKNSQKVIEELAILKDLPLPFLPDFVKGLTSVVNNLPAGDLLSFGKSAINTFMNILESETSSSFWQQQEDEFTSKARFIININLLLSELLKKLREITDCSLADEFYDSLEKLIKLILSNQKPYEYTRTDHILFEAMESPRGMSLQKLLELAAFRGKDYVKKLEGFLSNELIAPDNRKYDLITIVMTQYKDYQKWITSNLDKIFSTEDYLAWLCAVSGTSIDLISVSKIQNKTLNSKHLVLTLKNDALPLELRANLTSKLVEGYIWHSFDIHVFINENKLLEQNNCQLLIFFLEKLYEYLDLNKALSMTDELQSKLIDLWEFLLTYQDRTKPHLNDVFSTLALTTSSLLTPPIEKKLSLIEKVAQYAHFRNNEPFFMEAAHKIHVDHPIEAGKILFAMLKERKDLDPPTNEIKEIVESLNNKVEDKDSSIRNLLEKIKTCYYSSGYSDSFF